MKLSEQKGRYLIADSNLPQKHIVLLSHCYAFATFPDQRKLFCANCSTKLKKNPLTSQFSDELCYCSPRCKNARSHIDILVADPLDELLVLLKETRLPGDAQESANILSLLLQILGRRASENGYSFRPMDTSAQASATRTFNFGIHDIEDDLRFQDLECLTTNSDRFQGTERNQELSTLADIWMRKFDQSLLSDDLDHSSILQILQRIEMNSFVFPNGSGSGLAPVVSYINHSCTPNCVIRVNEEGHILLETLTNIRSGSEITISYGLDKQPNDFLLRKKNCKEYMKKVFLFDCGCE